MEFERAIYRVYERCIDGLREEDNPNNNNQFKSCLFLEILSFIIALFLFIILIILHWHFVHSPGCILNELLIQRNLTTLQEDQILYINIDKKFESNKNLRYQDDDVINSNSHHSDSKYAMDSYSSFINKYYHDEYTKKSSNSKSILDYFTFTTLNTSTNPIIPIKTNNETKINDISKNTREPSYDYKFAFDATVLFLPYDMIEDHKFQTLNLSLHGSECFGNSVIQGIIPLGGVDTVIMNYLMYSFDSPGSILTAWPEEAYYRWQWKDLEPYNSPPGWFRFKFSVLFNSMLCFFILSTVTALLVRVLISSGVVCLFPLFGCMQMLGYHGINLRIVSMSYPWIGLPLELIRSRNQSSMPFIIAHLSRVVIYYFLYQATQVLFTLWMYNHEQPGQSYIWIFVVMMLWEYYSMIYLRAAGSIQLFPRASLALFLIYHIYYFSYPSGFHVLALVVLFFTLLFLMIHCIRVYEIKAFELGLVSLDQPRMLYNALPWPAWRAALAPDYTLMMPMNMRSETAYNANIPNIAATRTNTPALASITNDNLGVESQGIVGINNNTSTNEEINNPILGNNNHSDDIENNSQDNLIGIELNNMIDRNNTTYVSSNTTTNNNTNSIGNILKRSSNSIVHSLQPNSNSSNNNSNLGTNIMNPLINTTTVSSNRGNYMRINNEYDDNEHNECQHDTNKIDSNNNLKG